MNNEYAQLMLETWQAACIDRPLRPSARVENKQFVMTITGNRSRWQELCQAAGVPDYAVQEVDGDRLTVRWPSVADEILGAGGLLAGHLPNYEPRQAQVHMGRLVQRAIEMRMPALAEAGTGTGKSFAYLAVALAMGKRVTVAAPTTALQMQLVKKDAPFLLSLPPFQGKKIAFAMGKSRYVCKLRTEDSVTGSLAVIDPRFMEWYRTTESGNLEELTFPLTYEDRGKVNVDDSCAGKACPLYDSCFYYVAKRARADADVVVTNHSLLALHHLYPGAGILPDTDVLVVDEAHQLPDYVRNALGIEFTVTGVRLAIRKLENAGDADEEKLDACDEWVALFDQEVTRFMADKEGGEVGVYGTTTFPSGIELASRLDHFANSVWGDGDLPDSAEEIRLARAANGVRSMAGHLRVFSSPTEDGYVRIVKRQAGGNGLLFCSVPFDVSEFIAGLCGIFPRLAPVAPVDHTRCARCHRTLTAEKVAVLEGRPYGPDCIQVVDVLGDAEVVPLAWWLANTLPKPTKPLGSSGSSPVIFTSATLAAPDMGAIKREYGLTSALEMQALSPFPYKRNMILFMPDADAPAPNAADRGPHLDYMVDTMHALVTAAQGGAFLLFTSNAALRYAVDNLGKKFQRMGLPVYVQGELPKMEIAKRVREDGNAVLFATKSFWEGVDIQGDALRLVVIDKLPFEAPNPLNQAQEAALRRYAEQEMGLRGNKLEWYPFEAMRVPRMVIDLKQGAGRLIRTATDAGVVAVLDPRVRKTQYGRNRVLPALPPGQVTSKLETACAFLRKRQVVVDGGGR